MRAKKCGLSESEKRFRRLNYCGTCKTLGSLYGQKARFLLNHDAVFLAEVLSVLAGERVEEWPAAYRSFNCLNMPRGKMPPALEFAAATNVVLTEFKLADHVADEKKRRYALAGKAFSADFQKAESFLKKRNFPLEKIKAVLQTQTEREKVLKGKTPAEILRHLARPTARATAAFFAGGVHAVGRSELRKTAYKLGFYFGQLIYLIDALEDYEKDFRGGRFNALRAAFGENEKSLAPEAKRKAVSLVRELEEKILNSLEHLPIDEARKTIFAARLSENVKRKLKTDLPVVSVKNVCARAPERSFVRRWRLAAEKARSLAQGFSWQMPVVFLFVFVFALVAPAQVKETRSARECFDLGFNLMFLGAIFGSVLAFPKPLWQKFPKRKKKREEEIQGEDPSEENSWCDWCDCCDCDCGDCCDCGCCCSCDNCDCCDCDCCDCSCD